MLLVLLSSLGIDDYITDESYNKLIGMRAEYSSHQINGGNMCVGQSKRIISTSCIEFEMPF